MGQQLLGVEFQAGRCLAALDCYLPAAALAAPAAGVATLLVAQLAIAAVLAAELSAAFPAVAVTEVAVAVDLVAAGAVVAVFSGERAPFVECAYLVIASHALQVFQWLVVLLHMQLIFLDAFYVVQETRVASLDGLS